MHGYKNLERKFNRDHRVRYAQLCKKGTLAVVVLGLTHVGCTREVMLPESEDTGAASQPGASGPDDAPEPSQPSKEDSADPSSKQNPQDPKNSEQSEDSNPSDNASPDPKEENSPAQACEDIDSRECVQAAPKGWQGPFRINHASKAKSLAKCKHGAYGEELLYENWRADEAGCFNCGGEVQLPPCKEVSLVGFRYLDDTMFPECEANKKLGSATISFETCTDVHRLVNTIPGSSGAFGYEVPGTVHKRVTCEAQEPTKFLPRIEAETFWRVCENPKKLPGCKAPDMACLDKRKALPEPACIVKAEKAQCPAGTVYQNKILVASKLDDSRNCSDCRVELIEGTQPDDFECEADVSFYDQAYPDCPPGKSTSGLDNSEVPDICHRAHNFLQTKDFIYIKPVKPKYSGYCKGYGWEPIGTVKATQWVTMCCNA